MDASVQNINGYPFKLLDWLNDEGPFYVFPKKLNLWTYNYGGGYDMTRIGAEIAYWCRKNGPVYHSFDGQMLKNENATSRDANDQHRFYFTTKEKRSEFINAIGNMPSSGSLFSDFNSIRLEESQAMNVTIYPYRLTQKPCKETLDVWFWVRDNCKSRVWVLGNRDVTDNVVFENVEDATLFKMKFAHREEIPQ